MGSRFVRTQRGEMIFKHEVDTAIILGAGFSRNAKLPLTSEMSKAILEDNQGDEIDQKIIKVLKEFLDKAFSWSEGNTIPSLEDLFTMIDLSANTGHNLGRKYGPKKLLGLRRMLIYRLFKVLDKEFKVSEEIKNFLRHYLKRDNVPLTHFVVLNWDIVLEKHLIKELHDINITVDYCIQAKPWNGLDTSKNDQRKVGVAKVHGSGNWLYCDRCQTVFYDLSQKIGLLSRDKIIKNLEQFGIKLKNQPTICPSCNSNNTIDSHIATFSYKKDFHTHAFKSSWWAAKQILTKAKNWIFVGYSLPEADYEFKHLLKTCQLKFAHNKKGKKKIKVIIKEENSNGPEHQRYEKFFGSKEVDIYPYGLDKYVECNLT